jgi:hypothetical protein
MLEAVVGNNNNNSNDCSVHCYAVDIRNATTGGQLLPTLRDAGWLFSVVC